MPKDKKDAEAKAKVVTPTTEATAFLAGLHSEFEKQVDRYHELTAHLLEIEARIELAEKQLCLTRDHLAMVIRRTEAATPRDWKKTLEKVRFVGWRLVDACVELLRENKTLTQEELLEALNNRMFRFRTNRPFREIHAALLRQADVKRTKDGWSWIGSEGEQKRFKLVKKTEAIG